MTIAWSLMLHDARVAGLVKLQRSKEGRRERSVWAVRTSTGAVSAARHRPRNRMTLSPRMKATAPSSSIAWIAAFLASLSEAN